jgi:hypothetical protein
MEALQRPEETAVLLTADTSTIVIGEVCEHESVNTIQRIASAALDLDHSYVRAAGWQCLGFHV